MNRWIPIAAVAALASLVPVSAFADGTPSDGPAARRDGGPRRERMRHRAERMRHRAARLLKALELTEAQKTALKESREAAAPVREDLRARLRAIREETRAAAGGERPSDEARKAARAKAKAAVESAREAVAPSATRFVGSLTPEQKQKLADKAKEHGKTFDEARPVNAVERLLLAPGRARARAR
jgi:Spy/CpxP family protein refolding chaperone